MNKKITPISARLGKTVSTGSTGTGASQPTATSGTAAVTGVPVVTPYVIDVKTPNFVGIGKEPHNRPQIPMTEPDSPNYSGTGTNFNGNVPEWSGGGSSGKNDNN